MKPFQNYVKKCLKPNVSHSRHYTSRYYGFPPNLQVMNSFDREYLQYSCSPTPCSLSIISKPSKLGDIRITVLFIVGSHPSEDESGAGTDSHAGLDDIAGSGDFKMAVRRSQHV